MTGIALKAMREKAAADSLKEHFGDVRLSMEECEDVARRLTTNGWTMKLGAVVEAKRSWIKSIPIWRPRSRD